MISVLLLASSAWAADSGDTLQTHIDQARLFVKKEWYDDAKKELEAAVASPDGRVDPEAWYLLATVRYELCDYLGAKEAAERAHSYAQTDDELQLAVSFEQFLAEQFGVVEIRAPYAGMTGKVDFAIDTPLFDPNLKLYLDRLGTHYKGKVLFPIKVGIPAGTYHIDGQQVVVAPGAEVGVDLPAAALAGRAATIQLARVEVSEGMSAWVGPEVSHLLPAADTQVSLTQPVAGPLDAGLLVDWAPRVWQTANRGFEASPVDWTVGVRIGIDLLHSGPIAIRPSIGYRYGYLPGISRPCAELGPTTFSCSKDAAPDLLIYGIGRVHEPFAELSVDWVDRDRKRSLGWGVKTSAEEAFGHLPAGSIAHMAGSTDNLDYTVDPGSRAFTATGFRFLANLTLAF